MIRLVNSKFSSFSILGILLAWPVIGQEKLAHFNEKLAVSNTVVIQLNSSQSTVVFETWKKNTVSVEAFIESDNLSDSYAQQLLDGWHVAMNGTNDVITIESQTKKISVNPVAAQQPLAPNQVRGIEVMLQNMLGPMVPHIGQKPMPLSVDANLAQMQAIRTQIEKEVQQYNDQLTRQMATWAAANTHNASAGQTNSSSKRFMYEVKSTKARAEKKVIVRVPESANLQLNIRHGALVFRQPVRNVKASLSHTRLEANVIDGVATKIHASYSPITIQNWNTGELRVDYVKNCRIETVKDIQLASNSSNVYINDFDNSGNLVGAFGSITIATLANDFKALSITLENSDFRIQLPDTAYNFNYLGSRSLMRYPKAIEARVLRNYGNESVSGFYKSRSTQKSISINAKNSELILQH